jgi:carbohydrate-binding DOMON domain-containing protein
MAAFLPFLICVPCCAFASILSGYTNNLPVDVVHSLYQPRFIIGVDVENKSGEEKLQRVSYYGAYCDGFWLLKKRMAEWIKGGWVGGLIRKFSTHVYKTTQPQQVEEETWK